MKYIVTTCCFLISLVLAAQVPGYMGKRIAIDANFQSMASPLKAITSGSSDFRFRYKVNLHMEYSLHRAASLGLQYDYISNASTVGSVGTLLETYSTFKGENLGYDMQAHGIGINYRKYLKGGLSPVGNFFQMYASYVMGNIHSSYLDYETFTDQNGDVTKGDNQIVFHKDGPVSAVVVGLGFGKRVIFANRFSFNYGVNFGIPYFLKGESFWSNADSEEDAVEGWESAKAYIRRTYGVNASIGFGILL